ncbi:MAG: hypothetical protein KKC14_16310, partial [Alphaproteobacteria bacterium]|nr:hypothetical protein [Alphaproteobacteria bacterium]
SPNIQGEATAMYLSKIIKPSGVKVTRIATGVPMGADIEYADGVDFPRRRRAPGIQGPHRTAC